jgi:hypothetical protein
MLIWYCIERKVHIYLKHLFYTYGLKNNSRFSPDFNLWKHRFFQEGFSPSVKPGFDLIWVRG